MPAKDTTAILRAQIAELQTQNSALLAQVSNLTKQKSALRTALQKFAVEWTEMAVPNIADIVSVSDTHWEVTAQPPWAYAQQVLQENP